MLSCLNKIKIEPGSCFNNKFGARASLCFAIIAIITIICSGFPYFSEDEALNIRLGFVGELWPDSGIVWVALIKILRVFVAMPEFRLITALCVIGYAYLSYRVLQKTGASAFIAFLCAMVLMLGPDGTLLHLARPEAFIAIVFGLSMIFTAYATRHFSDRQQGFFIFVNATLVFCLTHIHVIGVYFIPALWLSFVVIAFYYRSKREALVFSAWLTLAYIISILLGALPYLSSASLEIIKGRITHVPLYDLSAKGFILKQAFHSMFNDRGNNLEALGTEFYNPAGLTRCSFVLAWVTMILASLRLLRLFFAERKQLKNNQNLFSAAILQLLLLTAFVAMYAAALLQNRITNYYMTLYTTLSVVSAALFFVDDIGGIRKLVRILGVFLLTAYVSISIAYFVQAEFAYRDSTYAAFWHSTQELASGAQCKRISFAPPELMSMNAKKEEHVGLFGLTIGNQSNITPVDFLQRKDWMCHVVGRYADNKCVIVHDVALQGLFPYAGIRGSDGQGADRFRDFLFSKFSQVGHLALPHYLHDRLFPYIWTLQPAQFNDRQNWVNISGSPGWYFGGFQQAYILKPTPEWDAWCDGR